MKKKFFALFAAVSVLALSSCSTSDVTGNHDGSNSVQGAGTEINGPVTIEEQVLVDELGVKITTNGIEDVFMGTELKLLIENNSDADLTVQARNVSVNGYMVDCTISADVAAGKKANDAVTFMSSSLKECGIDTIADIKLSFHIFTSDGWDTYLDTDYIQIFTSAHENYTYTYHDAGETIYDGAGIRVVAQGIDYDVSLLGPELKLFIENESGTDITVQARNVSVNGFMVSTSMSADVSDGKRAIDGISFMNSSLEENGITEIKDVEFSLVAFDDRFNNVVETGTISLSF